MKAKKLAKWIVNPAADLKLKVRVRQKGHTYRDLELQVDAESGGVLNVVQAISTRHGKSLGRLKLKDNELKFLRQTGLLVPLETVPAEVSPEAPVSLKLLEMVPKIHRDRYSSARALVFNRQHVLIDEQARVQGRAGLPALGSFPHSRGLVWVRDPGTQMWSFYRGSRLLNSVKALLSGTPPQEFSGAWRELLYHARILVEPRFNRNRAEMWRAHDGRARASLERNRFAVLRDLVPPLNIAVLRAYFRGLEENGYLDLDRNQVVKKRFDRHNDVLLQYLHKQTGRLVRQVSGETILPSYSYLSAYLPGAELKRHLDRPQCAWNASLLIDQNPEVPLAESWPIFLEVGKAVHEVRLDFGDAVFYSGTEIPHWREPIEKGMRQTLGLLHYVPLDFVGHTD